MCFKGFAWLIVMLSICSNNMYAVRNLTSKHFNVMDLIRKPFEYQK